MFGRLRGDKTIISKKKKDLIEKEKGEMVCEMNSHVAQNMDQ
jgi:hypothetical protein